MKIVAIIIVAVVALTLGIYGVVENAGGSTQSKASGSESGDSSSMTFAASGSVEVHPSVKSDLSQRLSSLGIDREETVEQNTQGEPRGAGLAGSSTPVSAAGAAVEQKSQGTRPSAKLVESFDGLGFGFEGPQGKANVRNPSDNTIAVGPDHIVQIVN